jgi:DNA-binding response OmpR family regulator
MTDLIPAGGKPAGRILVVDDEPNIRTALIQALSFLGYEAGGATSGEQALALLGSRSYDAMLLDINLPDMGGVEIMQWVRQKNLDVAIVILTGHGTLDSAIAAIRSNVVEYLLKPASIAQIRDTLATALANRSREQRVQHLLQTIGQAVQGLQEMDIAERLPTQEASDHLFQAGPLLLDRNTRTAMVADSTHTVTLPESEARLLEALMRHAGQALTCRQLAVPLGYDVEEHEAESLVRPHISRLRQRLGAITDAAEMIRTVRGRGYMFFLG